MVSCYNKTKFKTCMYAMTFDKAVYNFNDLIL